MRVIHAADGRGGVELKTAPVPVPAKGEVLIRMAAAAVNPSDLAVITNRSGRSRSYPVPAGNEGSGTVVASGGGLIAGQLLGKRVAAAGLGGSWADFYMVRATQCLALPGNVSLEQGAMALVNPVTAVVLLDMVKGGRHRAVVNTAAASQLGRMIHRHFSRARVPVIHTVRRAEQADMLRKIGAEHVLVSTSADFNTELKELAHRLHATLILDAIGGPMTGQLADAAPEGSTILVYGSLSGEPIQVHTSRLISSRIRIDGFYLANWFRQVSIVKALRMSRRALKLVAHDLGSEIAGRFLLTEAAAAVEHARTRSTEGKALLVIDPDAVDLRP